MQELEKTNVQPVKVSDSIIVHEHSLNNFLKLNDLPVDNIFSPVDQRIVVFSNVETALAKLESENKRISNYISKFMAAVSSGLFDAALNYLWNETIQELRRRVAQYDIGYFFDTAINHPEKRKTLKDEHDLDKITDAELIHGSKEIGLISNLGFKHLDFIRYMRNWASAAHPNQSEITGLQLIGWLETCINEVISLPLSDVTIGIRKLLNNIKTVAIEASNAKAIGSFFDTISDEQKNNLLSGFFGMYTRTGTSEQTRDNIKLILPYLWIFVSEVQKQSIGIKYGKFLINNDVEEEKLSREFLEIVEGESYIPEKIRVSEIDTAIDNLLTAHRGNDNFYSEPAYARELKRLFGEEGHIPEAIESKYIVALVEVFLSNGNGIAWNAETIYVELLSTLNSQNATKVIMTIFDDRIIGLLGNSSLRKSQFIKLLDLMKPKTTSQSSLELIELIRNFNGPLEKIHMDSDFKKVSKPLVSLMS